MIAIEGLDIVQGDFHLGPVAFTIEAGEYGFLMGPSGSGKTSIIECICGLRRPLAGSIRVGEREVTRMAPGARGIGYVPQDVALFPGLPVRRQIAFALILRKLSNEEIGRRVDELASMLDISRLLDRMPEHLSGGEAQRVGLARALSAGPEVLLLDEPLSALDVSLHHEISQMLGDIQRQTGVTVLHVTHNQAEAAQLGQRLFIIEDGAIRETGFENRPASIPSDQQCPYPETAS